MSGGKSGSGFTGEEMIQDQGKDLWNIAKSPKDQVPFTLLQENMCSTRID